MRKKVYRDEEAAETETKAKLEKLKVLKRKEEWWSCPESTLWGPSTINFNTPNTNFKVKKYLKINPRKEQRDEEKRKQMFTINENRKGITKTHKTIELNDNDGKTKTYIFPNKYATQLKFDYIENAEGDNHKFYEQTLQPFINQKKDIFLSAYGTSGAGKTYTLGLESKATVKGVIDMALDDIIQLWKPKEIKLLSLQIFKGSVYNTKFIEKLETKVTDKEYNTKEHGSHVEIFEDQRSMDLSPFKWFEKNQQYIIPEFNFADMLNPQLPLRCYPDKCNEKNETDPDPWGVNFPPSKELIESLFDSGEDAIYFTGENYETIMKYLKEEVTTRRPTRVTPENKGGSSRSHLFLLFRFKDIKGQYKYFNILDLAGYEDTKNLQGQTLSEGKRIKEGIIQFRKLLQYSKGVLQKCELPEGKKFDENTIMCPTTMNKNTLVSTNTNTDHKDYKSSSYHTFSGITNQHKPLWCNNVEGPGPLFRENTNILSFPSASTDSSAMFNVLRGVSGILSNDGKYENIVYVCVKDKESNLNKYSLANTILFSFNDF